ncbi:RNA helicase [Limnohabitans sp. JirII-29]|uniref:DEAD/DEAH box helicase n=1 Tax=unclassified Limnohabitans TaxID=2626134 RepID=UPI000C1E845F|nr:MULTISPECIES: DEAD/DEAH box helicase [unclassified Limnohabitans]PIT73826.1 RNA helicase [Limnohabitans sp. JirII-31]PUE24108.1 RNA helicase [Limnohabitans sp. JirII-29]
MNFEELNLAPAILKAVVEQGYETPTPIQAQAIPAVLAGHDLLAGAQTGTGKTAAFTLPMLHKLTMSRSTENKFGVYGVRALVLTPTRELAAQVEESIRTYGKYLQLTSTVIFGGVGMNPQVARIKKGVDILVATPGRLLDLQQQGMLDLSTVQMLVLDEADRMLDMGFIHDVKKILALVPKDKQSLLFSATFSDEIRELANGLLKNPQSIQVTPSNTTVQRITQVVHPVGRGKKKALLAHIINEHNWSQVLVFTRTKFGANNVAEFLTKNGISAMALHGNKSQTARTQALAGFKSGDIRALVATDIAARGIDIDELPHVVNYEIPNISEDYVHRIGRTGRAGSSGEAVSLVSLDEEGFMKDIEHFTKQQVPVVMVEGFGPEPDEKAEPIAMGRQTLWGGLGKPPGRDVMAAAAKAARNEMMQRIRDTKGASGGGGGGRGGRGPAPRGEGGDSEGRAPRPNGHVSRDRNGDRPPRDGNRPQGQGPRPARQFDNRGPRQDAPRAPRDLEPRMPRDNEARAPRRDDDDFQPRANAHLGTQSGVNAFGHKTQGGGQRQPDPTRTSVDLMTERKRGGGGFGGGGGRRNGGGGGGGGRSGGGGGRSGGGGYGGGGGYAR